MNRYDLLKTFAGSFWGDYDDDERVLAGELVASEYLERRGDELWLTATGARMLAQLLEHEERIRPCRCSCTRAAHNDASPHACLSCPCASFTAATPEAP